MRKKKLKNVGMILTWTEINFLAKSRKEQAKHDAGIGVETAEERLVAEAEAEDEDDD